MVRCTLLLAVALQYIVIPVGDLVIVTTSGTLVICTAGGDNEILARRPGAPIRGSRFGCTASLLARDHPALLSD